MDRFQPPTAADDLATCVCCGERVHYEKLSDVGECPACSEYFEDEDMSDCNHTVEQSCLHGDECAQCLREANNVVTQSAVRVAEKLKKENTALKSQVAALREALEDCERALRFNPIYSGKNGAVTKAQSALAITLKSISPE